MTRPESVDDLTPDQRRGPEFASFDLGAFPVDGTLVQMAGAFLTRCTELFGEVEIIREQSRIADYAAQSRIAYHATPSAEHLEAALGVKQRGWDYCEKHYLAWLESGDKPEPGIAWTVAQWCEREGLELPWGAS